jgi:hypothetical protein
MQGPPEHVDANFLNFHCWQCMNQEENAEM